MTTEELQTLKNELQQINVELKSFKKELLTTRTEELEQIVLAEHLFEEFPPAQ